MGWIDDVAADEPIESAWGNSIRDRTVTPFANVAERDTSIPVPKEGQTAWLSDVNLMTVYNGTAWVPVPVGARIAYATTAGADVTAGATTEIVSAPFTLTMTRLCRIETHAGYSIISGNATGPISASVGFDHARVIRTATSQNAPNGSGWWGSGSAWQSLAAGAHTADVAIINAASGAAARVAAGTVYVAVQDYG
jgi:hypothetical protein